jgi:3-methyladenine DNA glycosylase AlkD/outer membrane protein assembly factor BamB
MSLNMSYVIHRVPNTLVLESVATGGLAGFMFCPLPNESRRAFEYDYGSTESREALVNINDFPELDYLQFFGIETPCGYQYDRCYTDEAWRHVRPLFYEQGKMIGYNMRIDKPPIPKTLNPLWEYTPPNEKGSWKVSTWGLWADEQTIWTGNRDGLILAFAPDGQIHNRWQLPKKTQCLTANSQGIYATCDDGNLYNLVGKLPQVVYNCRSEAVYKWYDFLIYGLDSYGDRLHISDVYGGITQLNQQFQVQWQQQVTSGRSWLWQSDDYALYRGSHQGVAAYAIATGKLLWRNSIAYVLCGVLTQDSIIIGTGDHHLYELQKSGDIKAKTTEMKTLALCDGAPYACALAADQQTIFVADHQADLCAFNRRGERLWKYPLGCGVPLAMRCVGDRLYMTTTEGTIACFDLLAIVNLDQPVSTVQQPNPPTASTPKASPKSRKSAKTPPDLAALQMELQALANPEKAIALARYFKTGKGEYAEGDQFLGITVPSQRQLAKKYIGLELSAIAVLLGSEWHEERLTGLLILTYKFPKANSEQQQEIVDFYLSHTQAVNNWDLVDTSCRPILGKYLLSRDRQILYQLAQSSNLWEQRIAIVTTGEFIKHHSYEDTLAIAKILLNHPHHLIHKAVGWMLREVGKQDQQVLLNFLEQYAPQMPRIMFRYAIEHCDRQVKDQMQRQ